jgi:signal recognition particle subunit SRP54
MKLVHSQRYDYIVFLTEDSMVLDSFGSSLRETLRKITGASYIDKDTIKEVVKEIQRILLKADVNVKLALELTRTLEKRASEEKPPAGMLEQDYMVKIIYEELLRILGEESKIQIVPQTIMLVGLYGQGKTTSAGKLAKFFTKKGLSVGVIAADVHRPAAYHQLKQIAASLNISFFGIEKETNPYRIVKEGLENLEKIQVKIIDTSGRDSLDKELIDEIRKINEIARPDERLLVIDATVGQQAGPQALAMDQSVNLTGIIITKMDGTGKAGGALSAVSQVNKPVYFIGTGEHLDDFEIFNPKKFLSRLLGLGDLESLMETVQDLEITPEEAEKSVTKLMSGKFNLKDMYDVWEKFSQPGIMGKIFNSLPVAKLPGAAKIDENAIESAESKLKNYRVILDSMTDSELEDPELINASRIERVARGSGKSEADVRALLKEYKGMKKNLKAFHGNRGFKKMLKAQMKAGNFGLENVLEEDSKN